MSQNTPRLSLPLIQAAQAQKHVTHNEAVQALDALVQPVAADRDRTTPPVAPAEGDTHLVAPGASDVWTGRDNQIASFAGNGWIYYQPTPGWRIHVQAEAAQLVFDGSGWTAETTAQPDTLGINTTADTTNRLAVASDATLLTHDGAGHQVKINKAAAADTNSLLFQTNWSGRAEMGCAGDDDFAIKVSADGASWQTAITIDAASGETAFPSGTAAPIETVTADGRSLRYPDGRLEFLATRNMGSSRDFGNGSVDNAFRSPFNQVVFPVAFLSAPVLTLSVVCNEGLGAARVVLATADGVTTTGIDNLQSYRLGTAAGTADVLVHIHAIGRWR
ncbi:DUF2793 domain-containing protein [Jannaschia sp. M317]|uniref:DUF2793 domain-containing protein n=1 Tax=Jannaschia sp. M317 TaxID=2867011 RepID=UPI0021A7A7D7|nr:DUF2793 domain-containing protein [Jannaschia sp. M317]UWQ19634.1 DUF2793 domain-containing protein [Jannaschia sp. M317]